MSVQVGAFGLAMISLLLPLSAADQSQEINAQYVEYFSWEVGPQQLAEIALLSRFYVCMASESDIYMGYALSWRWAYRMLLTRGTEVKLRKEGRSFWVHWPKGEAVRFRTDHSKASLFVSSRCRGASKPAGG